MKEEPLHPGGDNGYEGSALQRDMLEDLENCKSDTGCMMEECLRVHESVSDWEWFALWIQ